MNHSSSPRNNKSNHVSNISNTHPSTPLASTTTLETKLKSLRNASNDLSHSLTQKLATSKSGQDLLHIGPSLSTLPPDLSTLESELRPLLEDLNVYANGNREELARVERYKEEIVLSSGRASHAHECAALYEDLLAGERDVKRDAQMVKLKMQDGAAGENQKRKTKLMDTGDDYQEDDYQDEVEHMCSLERSAHTTLHLVQELNKSTSQISTMTSSSNNNTSLALNDKTRAHNSANTTTTSLSMTQHDIEKSQFLMKLAPRIRRLESTTTKCLSKRLEVIFTGMVQRKRYDENNESDDSQGNDAADITAGVSDNNETEWDKELIMVGHCLRGLAILGRGNEAESTFARVAILPLIRQKISIGRLDEGGSRGECANLFFVLDDMTHTITSSFGTVLRLSESIFGRSAAVISAATAASHSCMDVDLVTAGVWIPIATTLMADPTIKMAIFSPGIASILQANYMALDVFLSELASRLLCDASSPTTTNEGIQTGDYIGRNKLPPPLAPDYAASLFLQVTPSISKEQIRLAQTRIYAHNITADFLKKWNLPIYYQLRFGESCTRLEKAISSVQADGWKASVFSGSDAMMVELRNGLGFELPFFMELYDILRSFWRADVILRPLSHRFLRGAVQLIVRVISFVKDGLIGKIQFGGKSILTDDSVADDDKISGDSSAKNSKKITDAKKDDEFMKSVASYTWGNRADDVAAVAWELTVLEMSMTDDYLNAIVSVIANPDMNNQSNVHNIPEELEELQNLISEALLEASEEVGPLIQKSWEEIIVTILIEKCCVPLSAVKGVAATYRMTNRPPPTQASPFVSTILRPLQEFDQVFANRTPPHVESSWKEGVISIVAERYSSAVEELIATVKRTEVALKNRKARRSTAGGKSDGEKVKLQLFLDYREFSTMAKTIGVDVSGVEGIVKLKDLTKEAESLQVGGGASSNGDAN